jgi:hypothetical protein
VIILKWNIKIGIIIGIALIITGIVVGIITENDIGFFFAGMGTSVIGISILVFINNNHKGTKENDDK